MSAIQSGMMASLAGVMAVQPLDSKVHALVPPLAGIDVWLRSRLFAPAVIAPLVAFRVAFGLIMVWEVWQYFRFGWIGPRYVEPRFYFPYYGFDWLRPLPYGLMYLFFVALLMLAACIALGAWYRASCVLFFVGWSYVFLLDQTYYFSSTYLASLATFILIFVPANGRFSIDAWRHPRLRTDTTPSWTIGLLCWQFALIYFYSGLSKLNSDWLLHAQPMRTWLPWETDFPLIGPMFTETWVAYAASYIGLAFDLSIGILLLFRRTLLVAILLLVAFHLTNWRMWDLGTLPEFMIVTNVALFLPASPSFHRLLDRMPLPGWLGREGRDQPWAHHTTRPRPISITHQRITMALLAVYVGFQVLMPLRVFLYPGNVAWTQEGNRFSWHMRTRQAGAGNAEFTVTDSATSRIWKVDPLDYLTSDQAAIMTIYPDMTLQFAHYLAKMWQDDGFPDVHVQASTFVSINYRPTQPLVDPDVDLTKQPRTLGHKPWLLPLVPPIHGWG